MNQTAAVTRKGDVQAALEHADEHARIEMVHRVSKDGYPIAIVPQGFKVEPVKALLDHYLMRPERKKNTVVITELSSLAEYVNRFKTGETIGYVDDRDADKPKITVVFDDHESTQSVELRAARPRAEGEALEPAANTATVDELPLESEANWREFRAVYNFPLTAEWRAWSEVAPKWLSQADLAQFLEEHVIEVLDPQDPGKATLDLVSTLGLKLAGPSKLLQISRTLAITSERKLVSQRTETSGEQKFIFEEAHKDEGGAAVSIPDAFAIGVPVFRGSETLYRVPVRLRYRLEGAKLKFNLSPMRLDQVLADAIEGAANELRTKTAILVLHGAP